MAKRARSLWGFLTAIMIVITSLPWTTAQAASRPLTATEAVALLQGHGVLQTGDIDLLSRQGYLTREQAAALFVRCMGALAEPELADEAVPFTDAQGRPSSGVIAMAARLGLMRGDGNGTFRPDDAITYAEVMTVLLRIVEQEPPGPWQPESIFAAAGRLGLVPAGVQGSAPADQGHTLWALATAMSQVLLPTGNTVLQQYLPAHPSATDTDKWPDRNVPAPKPHPAGIILTADSPLGNDLPGGATNIASTMTVRATVVDAAGTAIRGYRGEITLTRDTSGSLVTDITGSNRLRAVNGVAEFPVQAANTSGFDIYTATAANMTSEPLALAVRKSPAPSPNIAEIRGHSIDGNETVVGYVAPDADYMEIELVRRAPPHPNEPHYWATANVYCKGESSPFVTGAIVDMASQLPVIRIPKDSLKSGKFIYEVSIDDGAGESARSPDLGLSEAVNAVFSSDYQLHEGLYDAAANTLVLSTSGTAGGIVTTDKLKIEKGGNTLSLGDVDVQVTGTTASRVTLSLGSLSIDPGIFHGAVLMDAQDGWFTSNDGILVARGTRTATLRPLPFIQQAIVEVGARRLRIQGEGLAHGAFHPGRIKVGGVALKQGTTSDDDRVTAASDTQITIALSAATLTALEQQTDPMYVTADVGWLTMTVDAAAYNAAAISGPGRPVTVQP